MSVLNPSSASSGEESPECPLCMEYLELDDIHFYPCSCSYQVCRFCWNRILTEGSGLCPACRTAYEENPADFKPLSPEELAKIKAEKRLKDQAKKQKISENRKHLANVRVVQKNLVFVVGLPPRIASDSDSLKKPEYFGRFGKIHKVVINSSNSYAGNAHQGPSASAYVTYLKSEDALRAIQAVNNKTIDGRTLKASLGTTKYCSHFMKNQSCPKQDCMYLHELGDEAASFTKEEMQQGKHTDYEKSLHEEIQNNISILSHSESPSLASGTDKSSLLSSSASSSSSRDEPKSPSPKENWPNLSLRAGGNNGSGYTDCENINHRIREGLLPTFEREPPEGESKAALVENNFFDDSIMNSGNSIVDPHQIGVNSSSSSSNSNTSNNKNIDGCNYNGDHHRGWSPPLLTEESKDIVNHSTDDEDVEEEDELGFDPFHETQKALAEMLESESKLLYQDTSTTTTNNNSTVITEEPPNIMGQHQQQQQHHPQHHQYHHSFSSARSKLPPPGFNMVNLNPNNTPATASHDIHSYLPGSIDNNHLSSSSSGSAAGASSSHFTPSGFLNGDFGGGYRNGSSAAQLHYPHESNHLTRSSTNNSAAGVGDKLMNYANKDWQDGLRALLPNISVSFGTLPTSSYHHQQQQQQQPQHSLGPSEQQQQQQQVGGGNSGAPNSNHHNNKYPSHNERIQQQQTQHRSGWNNISPNDWTVLDPAIVGGQLADSRAESPPNWIKANLEQLTTDSSSSPSSSSSNSLSYHHHQNNVGSLLSGFENLGLSSSSSNGVANGIAPPPPPHHHHHHQQQQQQFNNNLVQTRHAAAAAAAAAGMHHHHHPHHHNHHWGQSTPPPGFSRAPLQNQYSNMGLQQGTVEGHQIESTYG